MPAIAAAVTMLCVTIAVLASSPDVEDIEHRANVAFAAGDYPTARIWFMRLAREDPTNPRFAAGLKLSERRVPQQR